MRIEKCYSEEEIIAYFYREIAPEELKTVEAHMNKCDLCLNKSRKIFGAYSILKMIKARPEIGQNVGKLHLDYVSNPAAAGKSIERRIYKTQSKGGTYIITIKPNLDGKKYKLEIESMADQEGNLYIESLTEKFMIPIRKGKGAIFIEKEFDLNNVIVYYLND